jgi:hypothetical protein
MGPICPELAIENLESLSLVLQMGVGLFLREPPIAYRKFCRGPISRFEIHLECERRLEINVA